jgi:hypothetical protein
MHTGWTPGVHQFRRRDMPLTPYQQERLHCEMVELFHNRLYLPTLESIADATDQIINLINTTEGVTG